MNILAIDPANKTGFAHSTGISGTWDLTPRRDESKGMRLIRFRGKLNDMKSNVGVDLLVFESARNVRPKHQGALVVQAELQGVLKLWCEENKIEYRGYSPMEVKKHATGSGSANKDKMINAAERKWKRIMEDDNEADALWILDLAQKEYA